METIKQTIKQLFSNQYGRIPSPGAAALAFGDAMIAPGSSARPAAVALPEIPAPAVVAPAPVSVIEPVIAAPVCSACGQLLPQPVAIAEPAQILVDPDAERTDLPPRTQPQIAALIAGGETPEARVVRILNDKMRYAHQQGR